MQNHDMNEKNYENPLGQTDETEEEELLTPEEEAILRHSAGRNE